MATIQDLRKICENKLEHAKLTNNSKKVETFENIHNILSFDDAFNKLQVEVSFNILLDLGFTKAQAKKIYADLISK